MSSKSALGSNESRATVKCQPLWSTPSLTIFQPTLDAVVELRAIFSLSDDPSSQYNPFWVNVLFCRVSRTGFATFIQSDLLITSSHILTPIDGYESPSITCGGVECLTLKIPSRLQNDGFHHLSYLRLKTVGKMPLNKVAIVHPTSLHPLSVAYHAFLQQTNCLVRLCYFW